MHLAVELRARRRTEQVPGLEVLHQVSRLVRARLGDSAGDQVRNDVVGLHDGKDDLRDLADGRDAGRQRTSAPAGRTDSDLSPPMRARPR